ncbi:hypothetical protein CHLRE_17g717919v5 [Chlamydomonas reinhardtii]|uniref:Uncharacterized protein n=1 Tax=Chlamydomonas reinhardtii TaxID=3055 RepID=A0A2K3CQ31_CHLRE|nr:uncharacterized protein CHLRE_17g717919v5 [Chlamydomonas reinhardtii]XP_042914659.1 uncharacterized protein CHLRE_17g717919v5 [Chlamydomonas reinhardtii]PNW70390.1 hypothetical protein CHLRE_17g717919v5 [Chlamydomonas reinhardtii]PNW70391.1 hypothetical protein CHLRE_17g717919v5 [Chlamydomonas reinhardtii]
MRSPEVWRSQPIAVLRSGWAGQRGKALVWLGRTRQGTAPHLGVTGLVGVKTSRYGQQGQQREGAVGC